jgi:hypothetical protein
VPPQPALVAPPGSARFAFSESEDPVRPATRLLRGEVIALSQSELGAALEALLRTLTTFAALTEATLEVGVVRNVPPRVASPRALESLARVLWEAGFPIRFAPSWTPSPEADAYLGVEGGDGLAEFLHSHAAWSPAP